MSHSRPLPQASIRYGRIVYAWIEDRHGFRKLRPALIITSDELISQSTPLTVVAITTTFPQPPPVNHIELPWHPNGNTSTRLRQRSAAVLDWQAEIEPDDVVGFGGNAPPRLMLAIEKRLEELLSGP